MAILPVPEQLGERQFQDRSQVVRPQIDTSGQQRLARTVQQVTSNMNERLDQSSLQKAKIHFQRKKLEADTAFDQDQDFETYQQRYDEMLTKAADESAKLVRNPRMQEMFKQEISLYKDEGSANIRRKAFGKEIERGIADLDESITLARENYLRASNPADREFARESMMEAIDFAEASSYIDSAKAQSLRKSAAVDLAIASIDIETPENQVKLLKENKGIIDLIPMDKRLEMIKVAESKAQTSMALTLANGISAAGGDAKQRLDEANKIGDVKLREQVKQQIEVDLSREKRAAAESAYNAYDTLKKIVINDNKSSLEVKDENFAIWQSMTADQQEAILSMDSSKSKSSNLNTYNTLNQLAAKDRNQAYMYFMENASKLSESDIRKWSDRLAKPEELDGYLSNSQRLDTAMFKIGVKKKDTEDYKLAQDQLDSDVIDFQKEKGRKPNAEELDKIINGITDKVVDSAWYNPATSDKYGFNLTPQERKARGQDNKLAIFEKKLSEYTNHLQSQQGDVPVILTDDQIDKLYKAWDRAGLLNGD
jgi:hypothetical protein